LSPSSTSPFSVPEILAHETHEKTMTNNRMTNGEKKLTARLEEFVIRVSSFVRHSSFELRHFY
jgi:hypothetical protein